MLKNGVKFNDKHSIDNWDLLMVSKTIGQAIPKTIEIDIPGQDGKLDLTECYGQINYYNRTLEFTFDCFQDYKSWAELLRQIKQHLHGKMQKIILDVDPDYYYYGRCKVDSFTNDKQIGHIMISCDCEPYKYKLEKTVIENDVIAKKVCTYQNLYREVVPEITVTDTAQIEFENATYSFSKGTFKNLNIVFKEGTNTVKILSGSGKITFSYQEATL